MCLVFILAWVLTGANAWAKLESTASSQKKYALAQKAYHNFLYSKNKMKQRANWTRVISRFQRVLKMYPQTREGYKSMFTLGRLYQQLGKRSGRKADIDKALSYYHRLETRFPSGWLTDDALYFKGELYLGRKNYTKAHAAFQKILTDHPKGDFVPKARHQLESGSLKNNVKSPNKKKTSVPPQKNTSPTTAVLLKDLTFVSGKKETRVVLKVDGKITYSKKRLKNPDRVYFDFNHSQWDEHIPAYIPVDDGRIRQMRLTQSKEATSRLVLDLDEEGKPKVMVQVHKNRLIIVIPENLAKFAAVKTRSSKKGVIARVAGQSKATRKTNHSIPVVVLDAGHGGKDYGAKGANGLYEKDLNLKISRQVKQILEKRYGIKVIMTREDDTFIELKDRGKIANRNNADLFVSIHANAAKRKSAHGIETYYLGAGSSDEARETAERENGDLVHSVSDNAVQEILASLISTTKINDSSRLAARVQGRLYKNMSKMFSGVQNLGVKEGPFYVLHDTNMPSILIEVGFVTNRIEGKKLKSSKYQKWLAESIARGIYEYLKEKAPSI